VTSGNGIAKPHPAAVTARAGEGDGRRSKRLHWQLAVRLELGNVETGEGERGDSESGKYKTDKVWEGKPTPSRTCVKPP
jgi:hypothetical protein